MSMAPSVSSPVVVADPGAAARTSYVDWAAVISGALAAAAISLVLLTFGAAIGLSLTSPWPHAWGLSSTGLAILAAIWTVLVEVGSFAAGGYLAGRLRARFSDAPASEVEFRDGVHGFLAWALAAVLGAWLLSTTIGSATRTGAQAFGPAARSVSANANPIAYAADLLFRSQRTAAAGDVNALERSRAEAERIIALGIAGDLPQRDRTYLAQLVSTRTGLAQPEAERRVDEAMNEARMAVDRARRAAVLSGFLSAASLLIAAAAACAAAALGGKDRDRSGTLRLFGAERFW